ncbi:hypothetical protein Fmac_006032 [Flemingia macrophylla]|uniref:Uncharacterized protein n=1 Tax=Flemingia macrophylla TaxID=520843 RepID=A0ABD1NAL9_9FABA
MRIKAIVVVVIDSSSICSNAIFVNQVVLEEKKEVDITTGQTSHRIIRGIHDKVVIHGFVAYSAGKFVLGGLADGLRELKIILYDQYLIKSHRF